LAKRHPRLDLGSAWRAAPAAVRAATAPPSTA
jgi:hypothetical protein